MRTQKVFVRSLVSLILISLMLVPGLGNAYPSGIGGEEVWAGGDIDDVAKEGCLCHAPEPSNEVMIILDDVPFTWAAGATYDMRLEIIGGPESSSGGFSARVSAGEFSGDGQDWNGDTMARTHQNANSRIYTISWTAPETDSGIVNFWITGNAVNGNGAPDGDLWNQLQFSLSENGSAEDKRGTKTLIAGSGTPEAPEKSSGIIDISTMGAGFRAHWLGLLGFGAVIAVIIFCGLVLRYGFSTSYKGRSNLLRLRYKVNRRGDQ